MMYESVYCQIPMVVCSCTCEFEGAVDYVAVVTAVVTATVICLIFIRATPSIIRICEELSLGVLKPLV